VCIIWSALLDSKINLSKQLRFKSLFYYVFYFLSFQVCSTLNNQNLFSKFSLQNLKLRQNILLQCPTKMFLLLSEFIFVKLFIKFFLATYVFAASLFNLSISESFVCFNLRMKKVYTYDFVVSRAQPRIYDLHNYD